MVALDVPVVIGVGRGAAKVQGVVALKEVMGVGSGAARVL